MKLSTKLKAASVFQLSALPAILKLPRPLFVRSATFGNIYLPESATL